MVEYNRLNGVGIWELDDYEEVRKRIIDVVRTCKDSFMVKGGASIIVFGSYGRGRATPKRSDLDVDIFTEGKFEDMVGHILQDETIYMDKCVREGIIKEVYEVFRFNGVEVRLDIYKNPSFFLKPAMEMKEPHIAYDLVDEKQITIEDISGEDFLKAGRIE